MRMIGGLAKPTSGEISMFGYAGKDLSKVRSRVGCLIEAPGVYPNMTAKENIEMKCRLFGISKKVRLSNQRHADSKPLLHTK